MNGRVAVYFLSAAALAAALWWTLRPPELPSAAAVAAPVVAAPAPAPAPAPAAPVKLSAAATMADPRINPLRAEKPLPVRASLFNEYLRTKNYRALYDRLKNSPEGQAPDGKLVLYEVLRYCATITEGRRPGYRAQPPKREDFMAGIATTDPLREKRMAAYEELSVDQCAGFGEVSITQADLMKLLSDSAAGGNPQAQALSLEQQLWAQRRGGAGAPNVGVTLTDAQVENLRQIMGTRDPEAIRVAGRIMANHWNDYALRVGPEQQPVEPRAFMNAFLVLSCEYGAPCGADTPRMLQACAFQGHCDAQNYPDFLFYYGSTPHDSQMLVQYRGLVRNAIETGDWSQIQVVRGLPPAGNRVTFVPGPR